jgi:predicted component of type VI protein secretion system
MAKLVIHQSDGRMREILLDRDRITIGRRPDHDLCLPFPAVSADHAEIITVVADSFLHDLGSTNGTLVNGTRVSKHFLRNNDTIDIGRQQLVYLTNETEKVEPLPPVASDKANAAGAEDEAPRSPAVDPAIAHALDVRSEDVQLAPVDELLTDLMEMHSESSAAVEMPPAVSIVPAAPAIATAERSRAPHGDSTPGAYIEVMSGPNAGQISPMTKEEFVLGKAGATIAVIRRDAIGYRLMPRNSDHLPTVNGRPIEPTGASLEFGDTIGVGGVVLRFNRRPRL